MWWSEPYWSATRRKAYNTPLRPTAARGSFCRNPFPGTAECFVSLDKGEIAAVRDISFEAVNYHVASCTYKSLL